MRYPAEQKDRTRSKIVGASAAVAKRGGFSASGIDALAEAAGVTSGAVYKHFDGKDGLLRAIIEYELAATARRFANADPGRAIDAYLSLAHVEHAEAGCLLPALASEVARATQETRHAYERAMDQLISTIATSLGEQALALALVSLCVGAVTIARGLTSDKARREILSAARTSAHALLGARRGMR
jgi:AcrR family transcriptional regulator